MEGELARSAWFAGDDFSAADIQMSFPVEAAAQRAGLDGSRPKLMGTAEWCPTPGIAEHVDAPKGDEDQRETANAKEQQNRFQHESSSPHLKHGRASRSCHQTDPVSVRTKPFSGPTKPS